MTIGATRRIPDSRLRRVAAPQGPTPGPRTHSALTLATVCLGYFMASWGMGPVASILPTITRDLDISVAEAGWIMTVYFLMLVGTVLPAGRLGDVYGHGKVFGLGVALFTAGGVLCGLSNSFVTLLAARGIQGVGSALIFGTSLAIIAATVAGRHRGRAIGFLTVASSASGLIGVGLATWSVQNLNWHWAFILPVPLGLVGAALGPRLKVPRVKLATKRIDWAGAALLFAALSAAMLGLNHLHEGVESFSGGAPYHLSMHILAVALFVAFLKVERRAEAPLLGFKLLRNGEFSSAIAGNGLAHMSMLATTFVLPFLLERGRDLTPGDTRVLLMAQQAAMVTCSLGLGYLYDRSRSPFFGAAMLGSIAAGLAAYSLFGGGMPFIGLLAVAAALGAGLGGFTTVNNTAIMAMAGQDQRGFSSGLVELTRQSGHAVGVSLSSSFMAGAVAAVAIPTTAEYVEGFHQATLAMAVMAACGVLAILYPLLQRGWDRRSARPRSTARPSPVAGGSE